MQRTPDVNVSRMFNRIARTYDLLNHILSAGIDRRWRRKAIRMLGIEKGNLVLDCSAGTGDMSLCAFEANPHVKLVLVDPAEAMLINADSKASNIPPRQFHLVRGVAEGLPFADASFDCFMVAFGIRNFDDLDYGLSELARILKPGGRGVILEFTPDRSRLIDRIFRWYMNTILIKVGNLISRDDEAYNYLARTITNFLPSDSLLKVFASIGLTCRKNIALSFGIAHLFVLEK
jgi:demethylmenaquinone methyltransferase / 2-methoxy-6-polyprenyl-1,4-benzoquinol methylase